MALELDQLTCSKCGAVYHDVSCGPDEVRFVCICPTCRREPEPTITLKTITVVAVRPGPTLGLLGQSAGTDAPDTTLHPQIPNEIKG